MLISTSAQEVYQLEANLCYAFVHPTRILILYALKERSLNVTELTRQFKVAQPKMSRHLRILRDLGLVYTTRQGTTITYALADCRLIEALDLLRGVLHDNVTSQASLLAEFEFE
jgi:DNA-binding transcriptional ArsR family regulator